MKHTMNLNDVLIQFGKYQNEARKVLNPSCHVCKVCNGRACAGRYTNSLEFGAKGNNNGFIYAYDALKDIKIELDVIDLVQNCLIKMMKRLKSLQNKTYAVFILDKNMLMQCLFSNDNFVMTRRSRMS